jgi:hypothetical protein
MPPHSVHEPQSESLHHSTIMNDVDNDGYDHHDNEEQEDEHDDDDHHHNSLLNDDDSIDSDVFREQRRRCYEVCQTDEELFAQHNNIQSIFDNRHHEIQFEEGDIQPAAGGGDGYGGDGSSIGGGSSLGGYSNMSYNDNSTQGSVRTREELRLSLIARRRRLAQLENAMDGEGSIDMSLRLNRSERDGDGDNSLSSVSINESITDSLIARIMGKKKKKKEKEKQDKGAAEKKKSKSKKSSSKSKDRYGKGGKDKSDSKKDIERKKSSKSKRRDKDKEKRHKSKKSEKKQYDDDKKSKRKSSRRRSNSSSEDESSSSGSETDDEAEEYRTRRRSGQQQPSTPPRQNRSSSNNDGAIDMSSAKQMMVAMGGRTMAMGGKTIEKLKQMAPSSLPTTSMDRQQQQQHHHSSSTGVVYFACNESTGMCAFHPDVQLRKKSMFGGWNDVLKQCPKCASESYRGGGRGEGQQYHQSSGRPRKQVVPGGDGTGAGMRHGGGGMNWSIPSGSNHLRHAQQTTTSDSRMMRQQPPSDHRGVMYRGQVHPQTSRQNNMMPSSHQHPMNYRRDSVPQRQYQGQQQQRSGGGGASSKPTPRDGKQQFYNSMHFPKSQDDKASTSRRSSYPDMAYPGHFPPQPQQTKPSTTSNSPPRPYPSSLKNTSNNGRRAHFGLEPPPSSRPPSNSNGMSNKMANVAPKRISIGDVEENQHGYTYGDEARRRDMIEDTNEEMALQRISNLKPGYPAFIKRSTGKWTYAKVKSIDSEMIVFVVDANGSSKAYNVKHWTGHIRTLRATSHDGWY